MIVTFSITYLHHRDIDATRILALLFAAHILHVIAIPLVGALADRVGRRPVYIVGAALTMAWPFAAFPMFDTGGTVMILAAIMLGDRKSVVSGKRVAVRLDLGGRRRLTKKKKNNIE